MIEKLIYFNVTATSRIKAKLYTAVRSKILDNNRDKHPKVLSTAMVEPKLFEYLIFWITLASKLFYEFPMLRRCVPIFIRIGKQTNV